MKLFKLIIITLIFHECSFGQDIHWSQYNDNPLFLNPANAGNFKGDNRFIANHRNQWKSVTIPYSTISLSTDLHYSKNEKIGLGILFFHDVAGDGKFRTIELNLNSSYEFTPFLNENHKILAGVNIGLNQRQLNWDQFKFDNQFNGIMYNAALPTMEVYQNSKKTNFTIGIGGVYNYNWTEQKKIEAGLGLYNLNRPNQGLYFDKISRDIRTSLFVKGYYPLADPFILIPSMSLSIQGKYREFIIGSSLKYTLIETNKEYRALYGGLWMRNKDAAYISLGMDYQAWFLGVSYDINFSKLTPASNARGGYEIALRYILNRFKPKKIQHRICPDYI
jgi:type IX secretion system PorP/SprF family membrane protein